MTIEGVSCGKCGQSFVAQRRTARFCSIQCANAVRAKRYRDRRATVPMFAEQATCPICSRPFLSIVSAGTRQAYCSEDCRGTARKLRRDA